MSRFLEDDPDYVAHLAEDAPLPLAINVELTTRCNLRCVMCPKTACRPRTPPDRTMDEDVLQRILEDVLPRVARVDLVGDGELLLEPELLDRLLARTSQLGILVNACSNAVLLSEKIARLLVGRRLADLNVSLDGAREETFRAIRGASLERVVANLRRLRAIQAEAGTDRPRLHFSMVGMEANIRELPELMRLAAELGARDVTLQAMGEFEAVAGQSVYLRHPELGRQMVGAAREVGAELGVELFLWPPSQFEATAPDSEPTTPADIDAVLRKDCDFPWDVPYFTTEGKVLPCCAFHPLGDLKRQSFEEIWQGEPYRELRRAIRSTRPPAPCRTCPGRGWYPPTVAGPELVMGADDRQRGLGFYELETGPDGRRYRWAGVHATGFLRGGTQPAVELVLARDPHPEACGEPLVRIDQGPAYPVQLDAQAAWTRVLLPRAESAGELARVQVLCERAWRPAEHIAGSEDRRPLGVKVAELRLVGRRASVRFGSGVRLLGYWLEPEPVRAGARLRAGFLWQADLRRGEGPAVFVHVFRGRPPRVLPGVVLRTAGKLGVPLSFFQLDHRPPLRLHGGQPVSESRVEIEVPARLRPGTYQIGLGLWWPGGERVSIQETELAVRERMVLVGTTEVVAG